MVGVPVRDEDLGQPPALLVEGGGDGRLLGRVDGRAGSRRRVADEDADVVVEAAESVDFGRHGGTPKKALGLARWGAGANRARRCLRFVRQARIDGGATRARHP